MEESNKETHCRLLPQGKRQASFELGTNHRISLSDIDGYSLSNNNNNDDNKQQWQRTKPRRWITSKNFFVVSLLLNTLLLTFMLHAWYTRDKDCWNTHSKYTPLAADLDLSYHTTTFPGKFSAPSPWRHDGEMPIPKSVDDAWASITSDKFSFTATEDDFRRSGIPLDSAKIVSEQGGGYYALVEVVHYLHCLNKLRMVLPHNFAYYDAKFKEAAPDNATNTDTDAKIHLNHCVDMLRQVLMCKPELGLLGLRWVEGGDPIADYDRRHKCMDFEQILSWTQGSGRRIPVVGEPVRFMPS